jgi:hypothetical protein
LHLQTKYLTSTLDRYASPRVVQGVAPLGYEGKNRERRYLHHVWYHVFFSVFFRVTGGSPDRYVHRRWKHLTLLFTSIQACFPTSLGTACSEICCKIYDGLTCFEQHPPYLWRARLFWSVSKKRFCDRNDSEQLGHRLCYNLWTHFECLHHSVHGQEKT